MKHPWKQSIGLSVLAAHVGLAVPTAFGQIPLYVPDHYTVYKTSPPSTNVVAQPVSDRKTEASLDKDDIQTSITVSSEKRTAQQEPGMNKFVPPNIPQAQAQPTTDTAQNKATKPVSLPEHSVGLSVPASPVPLTPPQKSQMEQTARNLIVPPDTVVSIALTQGVDSKTSQPGDPVSAEVREPVYLGPYLAIPAGSMVYGKVTQVNQRRNKEGQNPYVVIEFDTLKRASESEPLPFSGMLVAYKTGLRGQDYVWRLPQKGDKKRNMLKSLIGGAVSGILINPFFGPAIGAGAGLLRSSLVDAMARGGSVRVKPNQVVPITVAEGFSIPVEGTVANQPVTGPNQTQERPVSWPTTPDIPGQSNISVPN